MIPMKNGSYEHEKCWLLSLVELGLDICKHSAFPMPDDDKIESVDLLDYCKFSKVKAVFLFGNTLRLLPLRLHHKLGCYGKENKN